MPNVAEKVCKFAFSMDARVKPAHDEIKETC